MVVGFHGVRDIFLTLPAIREFVMHRFAFACLLLSSCVICTAADPEKLLLWPDGAPGSGGNEARDKPDLTIYHAAGTSRRAAVVVLPGGGYGGLASSYEGHDVAQWLQKNGITGAVCMYRHRGGGNGGAGYKHPHPMLDAQRALRTLRAGAKKWNLDPGRIGILGFSAGGHLASTAATHFDSGDSDSNDPIDRVSCRPDFAVLCYAVIGMGRSWGHKGSMRNLLGDKPPKALVESLSNETQVTKDTPPTFLFHTYDDTVVPPENAVQFYLACLHNGVPSELHVFKKGRHGVGLAEDIPGAKHWPKLCLEWLRVQGVLNDHEK